MGELRLFATAPVHDRERGFRQHVERRLLGAAAAAEAFDAVHHFDGLGAGRLFDGDARRAVADGVLEGVREDRGDAVALGVRREQVHHARHPELFAGGVEIVRAGRDRGAQHGFAESREGARAVHHAADAVHQRRERLRATRVGDAQLRRADRLGHPLECGAVAPAEDRIEPEPARLVDDEAAGETGGAVDQ